MAGSELPPHVVPVPRWTLAIHAVQMLFAIIILGLDAYGIRWVAYNALIYSLVTTICTLGVCGYLIASQLFLHNLYNMIIALALHVWMVIFWIVDLGLVANLARIWGSASFSYYSYGYCYGYYCTYVKRDLENLGKREETTTYNAYYGALAAGAVFAAVEFCLWVFSAVILLIYLNKHRGEQSTQPNQPPPQYAPNNAQQAVPMEKYNMNVSTQPQQQYTQPGSQGQGQFVQPPQPAYNQQQYTGPTGPYGQDPISRQDTVSPVSQVGYAAPNPNASELGTPQQTYNPNVSELASPQHTGGYNYNVSELADRK